MHEYIILQISLFIIYYHICGLATTNILRLTLGNSRKILDSVCTCDYCNSKIPFFLQLPIISYILCKGKCKSCGISIPIFPLILEIVIFTGMSIITFICNFSFTGITLSFVFYEIVRASVIMIKGTRKENFTKQLFIAILSMIPFYICSLFVAMLYAII